MCVILYNVISTLWYFCVYIGHTSLSFYGNSYIKYRMTDSRMSDEVKVQLRIRTLQSRGVILHTHPQPCAVLMVHTQYTNTLLTLHCIYGAWTHFLFWTLCIWFTAGRQSSPSSVGLFRRGWSFCHLQSPYQWWTLASRDSGTGSEFQLPFPGWEDAAGPAHPSPPGPWLDGLSRGAARRRLPGLPGLSYTQQHWASTAQQTGTGTPSVAQTCRGGGARGSEPRVCSISRSLH